MIIHLDLDTFFCSCERVMNPSLIGKKIAVGGRGDPFIFDRKPSPAKKLVALNSGAFVPSLFHSEYDHSKYFKDGEKIRGIVTTASYEARQFGVKTGMTIHEALQKCPDITLLPPNHLLYHTMSHELMEYLHTVVPVMEQYSIDEMFGDLRGWIEDDGTDNFIKLRHWSHTIMKLGVNPTTFHFSLGYENWGSSKKQYTIYRLFNEKFIQEFAYDKFKELDLYPHIAVKYIGMSANKFIHHDPKTLDILEYADDTKMRKLTDALTKIRDKYGMDIVRGEGSCKYF